MQVDLLEKENPGLFNNPHATFADLYMKSGLYITEIVKRLYKGLADQIPGESQRIKHILENQASLRLRPHPDNLRHRYQLYLWRIQPKHQSPKL